MTIKSLKHCLLAAMLLALSACGIEIPQDKADYIGEWEGPHTYLSISSAGQVEYKRQEGHKSTSLNIPLKQFEGNNFVAGVGPLATTFVVSQPPHQENGVWVMVVDGVRLVRQAEEPDSPAQSETHV